MRKGLKRKPRQLLNPIQTAINRVSMPDGEPLAQLRARELSAVDAFAKGLADKDAWIDINNMLSMCETMAKRGIGPEALDACQRAERALIDAQKRFERTGKMGTTGEGLQAFRDLYEYHDLQRASVSTGEYMDIITIVLKKIQGKDASIKFL